MVSKHFKEIPGFPSYFINKRGQVWSGPKVRVNISGQFIKPYLVNNYLMVNLYKNKKLFHKYIHRLLLEVYVGLCPEGMECRHLDGNRQDNRLDNLCWGTRSENVMDTIQHGRNNTLYKKGIKHPNSILTEQDVRMIVYMYRTGEFTQQEIGGIYDTARSNVSAILNKRNWKHIWRK